MKRIFFTIILVAGFSCTMFGQFKLSLGPAVGMNYNFYSGAAIENMNASVNGFGVALAGQLDMKFTPVVGLQTTITPYDGLNAKATRTSNAVKTVQNFNIAYLMINPSLKLSIPQTGLGFLVGPGIGFKLQGSWDSYQIANGQRTVLQEKTQFTQVTPRFEVSTGMVYDFDLKGIYLSPYFTFNYGLTTLAETVEIKIANVQFGLAVKFGVIK